MWNGLFFWFIPVVLVVVAGLLVKQGKPLRMLWFFIGGMPLRPSPGVKHMFPGVFTPPDPAYSEPIPTFVDDRPDPEPPTGVRKKSI